MEKKKKKIRCLLVVIFLKISACSLFFLLFLRVGETYNAWADGAQILRGRDGSSSQESRGQKVGDFGWFHLEKKELRLQASENDDDMVELGVPV